MKKKQLAILVLTVSVIFLLYLICSERKMIRFNELFTDTTEFNQIVNTREESLSPLLDDLYFNEQKLAFDIQTNMFYYSLNESEKNAINPYVKFKTSDENIHIKIEEVQLTEDFIKNNESVKMIAYNDEKYSSYHIKVTLLPIMEIIHAGEVTNENVPMYMQLYDNSKGAAKRITVSDGLMHVRGGTSRSYAKKGFKLSLITKSMGLNIRNNNISLLGMRKDDDWVLYAAYNDQEKVRNVFSSNLWHESCAKNNSFGLDNGVEYKYIELFMNGQYYGLYALGYPLDEKQVGIDENKSEVMYKKAYWDAEINVDFSEKYGEVSGYELETDEKPDSWVPLREYYANIYEKENVPNEVLDSTVDILSAIDVYIYLNLIQGADHVDDKSIHNVFLTAKKRGENYVMLYSPWDMDQAWGNIWSDTEKNWCAPYGVATDDDYILQCGIVSELVKRNDKKILERISKRYQHLRTTIWTDEYINSIIDGYEEDIYSSGAYLRDMQRWPDGTYSDPENELSLFRQYVLDRFRHTDEYYMNLFSE